MAQLIADKKDIEFVLFEQFKVDEDILKDEIYQEYNKKTVQMIVSEARKLAVDDILSIQKLSDKGCEFNAGEVKVPKEFHKVYKNYCEGGWLSMSDELEWGGQGMPEIVSKAANEYFYGACNSFMLYNMLSHGAARLIESFGTDEQKKLALENMYSGKWSGTMLLTEPEAGSDVGALTTSAKKNDDGTYSITGSKIFISGGEQDMVENIIHPVLARIEDAPEGTRGISLFFVPKYRINEDGSLGDFNDVVCTGIEEKMGLHGNCTCSLTLGGKGECIGTLIGEENKGMAAMFQMMNEARQMVGLQGHSNASAAYMYALDYARNRKQTKRLQDPSGTAPAAIIEHPDVKRQLLLMKSYVEGMRSLIYFNALCQDKSKLAKESEEKDYYHSLEEVLTPIIKGYITDKSFEVCSHAIQVYGGYGYVEEFPVAQLLRDSRIFMIYEGTNGIQSIDLIGRKLGMKQGKPFMNFLEEIRKTVESAKTNEDLKDLCSDMTKFLEYYGETALDFARKLKGDEVLDAFSFSYPFLEATGDLTMAWMLLWRAGAASQSLGKKKKNDPFYKGQINTARFFIKTILPVTLGRLASIESCDEAVTIMEDSFYWGK